MNKFTRDMFGKNSTALSVVLIIVGLILVIRPTMPALVITRIIGVALLVSGAGSLFGWSRNRESTTAMDGGLGGLMAVAGLVLLIWPGLLVNLIPVAVGIGILVHGVTNLFKALELKKAGYSAWVTPLVLAVLSILGGIFILSNPMGMIKSIFRVIGIVLIYNGVTSLYISSRNS